MTEEELLKEFKKDFERDCYSPSCELRDCYEECRCFNEAFEDYKRELGFYPSIMVGLDE